LAAPKACSVGALPSSCQETVVCCPPWKVVVATGEVTKTLAKAEAERARTKKVEVNIVVLI